MKPFFRLILCIFFWLSEETFSVFTFLKQCDDSKTKTLNTNDNARGLPKVELSFVLILAKLRSTTDTVYHKWSRRPQETYIDIS